MAGANADGRLEVFYLGSDNAVWHRWQVRRGGPWSGQSRLGGWAGSVSVGMNPDGRQEISTVGSDHAVWRRWQVKPNGGWAAEARLPGWAAPAAAFDDVVAGANADGR
ncbi:MAG: hypothetical protein ACXVHI_01005, partial [Frankiaceae bacterium]